MLKIIYVLNSNINKTNSGYLTIFRELHNTEASENSLWNF